MWETDLGSSNMLTQIQPICIPILPPRPNLWDILEDQKDHKRIDIIQTTDPNNILFLLSHSYILSLIFWFVNWASYKAKNATYFWRINAKLSWRIVMYVSYFLSLKSLKSFLFYCFFKQTSDNISSLPFLPLKRKVSILQ